MESARPDRQRQPVTRLNPGIGRQSGDMIIAGEYEVSHGLMAHVFHDIQRHRCKALTWIRGLAIANQIFRPNA